LFKELEFALAKLTVCLTTGAPSATAATTDDRGVGLLRRGDDLNFLTTIAEEDRTDSQFSDIELSRAGFALDELV
jgi:hypothetical protein